MCWSGKESEGSHFFDHCCLRFTCSAPASSLLLLPPLLRHLLIFINHQLLLMLFVFCAWALNMLLLLLLLQWHVPLAAVVRYSCCCKSLVRWNSPCVNNSTIVRFCGKGMWECSFGGSNNCALFCFLLFFADSSTSTKLSINNSHPQLRGRAILNSVLNKLEDRGWGWGDSQCRQRCNCKCPDRVLPQKREKCFENSLSFFYRGYRLVCSIVVLLFFVFFFLLLLVPVFSCCSFLLVVVVVVHDF